MGALLLFFVGFGLVCVGGVSVIGYLNFLPVGVSWTSLMQFLMTRPESHLVWIGFLIMALVMYKWPFQS